MSRISNTLKLFEARSCVPSNDNPSNDNNPGTELPPVKVAAVNMIEALKVLGPTVIEIKYLGNIAIVIYPDMVDEDWPPPRPKG